MILHVAKDSASSKPRLNPFAYSKSRHSRRVTPPTYSDFRSYKPFLRIEFRGQCVYCRLPDGIKGIDNFGVDHYKPKSHYSELKATYSNLFYACNCCNRRKSDYWPTSEDLTVGRFIPNPCDHVMFEHLRFKGPTVEPRSAAGQQAESKMMLNDEESVNYRQFVIRAISLTEQAIDNIRETIRGIDAQNRIDQSRASQLDIERAAAEAELRELEAHLLRLGGTLDPRFG